MERPVECISCERAAPFTVNGFARQLPDGWPQYQGVAPGATLRRQRHLTQTLSDDRLGVSRA